ncbi:hypothetical protein Forpe1208_v014479 [Fusarium oxysporum f. sp. rapae]|uniref:Uncharacterized protein n=1 Tax=Fusarium oxysporum f. sp. rapae TaxID=485398 RepID=A0A8J5NKP1_FUSOX|nr:hypothetical protein Forpe1208_v014479 [Fusarium oxysporum f. sp. rapae]
MVTTRNQASIGPDSPATTTTGPTGPIPEVEPTGTTPPQEGTTANPGGTTQMVPESPTNQPQETPVLTSHPTDTQSVGQEYHPQEYDPFEEMPTLRILERQSPAPRAMSELELIRARNEQLKEQVAAIREQKRLERELDELLTGISHPQPNAIRETSQRSHRRYYGSSSDESIEIRAKDVIKLTLPTTIRKRDEWIGDLERAFEGALKRYKRDAARILFALDNMS